MALEHFCFLPIIAHRFIVDAQATSQNWRPSRDVISNRHDARLDNVATQKKFFFFINFFLSYYYLPNLYNTLLPDKTYRSDRYGIIFLIIYLILSICDHVFFEKNFTPVRANFTNQTSQHGRYVIFSTANTLCPAAGYISYRSIN